MKSISRKNGYEFTQTCTIGMHGDKHVMILDHWIDPTGVSGYLFHPHVYFLTPAQFRMVENLMEQGEDEDWDAIESVTAEADGGSLLYRNMGLS